MFCCCSKKSCVVPCNSDRICSVKCDGNGTSSVACERRLLSIECERKRSSLGCERKRSSLFARRKGSSISSVSNKVYRMLARLGSPENLDSGKGDVWDNHLDVLASYVNQEERDKKSSQHSDSEDEVKFLKEFDKQLAPLSMKSWRWITSDVVNINDDDDDDESNEGLEIRHQKTKATVEWFGDNEIAGNYDLFEHQIPSYSHKHGIYSTR